MTAAEVNIRLTAEDKVSSQVAAIKSRIGSLGVPSEVFSGIQRLQNMLPINPQGMMGLAMFGTLGAQALIGSISAIQSAASSALGAINEAARTQTLSLSQAGDLATQLGVSFGKAKELVAQTRSEIAQMAASLPGENSDYAAIFSQISATVAKTAKGDIQKFKQDALALTQAYGVLASIRGADATTGGSALNRLIAGSMTLGEAFSSNDITQKNPLLRDYIQQQLKIIGKSEQDWKNLTQETRQKILIAAGKQAVSQETLASFEGTVDSMIATFKSTLFDQDIGIFGFLRPLKEAGGKTALDYVQTAMQALSNLLNALGRFVQLPDPMLVFTKATDWLTRLINGFTGLINGGSWEEIDKVLGEIPKFINNLLKDTNKYLEKVDWEKVGQVIGKLFSTIVSKIFDIDYGQLARLLFNLLIGIIKAQASALGQAITDALSSLGKILQDSVGRLFGRQPQPQPQPEVQPMAFQVQPSKPLVQPMAFQVQPSKPLVQPRVNNSMSRSYAFSPVVNIQGSPGSPNELADVVISRLDSLFKNHMATQLA